MRAGWFLLIPLNVLTCAAFTQDPAPTPPPSAAQTIERIFVSGGRVNMNLSAGSYAISPSTLADKIVIRWRVKKPEEAQKVRVTADVNGSECVIETHGPRNSLQVEIGLPARSDLYVRLKAGDLDLRGIEGNKDIECRTGDVTIDIGRADDYGPVAASVRIGDLEGPPFGVSKGGFARKFHWQGPGKDSLHAHVGVGSLSFLGTPSARRPTE